MNCPLHNEKLTLCCIHPQCKERTRLCCPTCLDYQHVNLSDHRTITINRIKLMCQKYKQQYKKLSKPQQYVRKFKENVIKQLDKFENAISQTITSISINMTQNLDMQNLNKVCCSHIFDTTILIEQMYRNNHIKNLEKTLEDVISQISSQLIKICDRVETQIKSRISPYFEAIQSISLFASQSVFKRMSNQVNQSQSNYKQKISMNENSAFSALKKDQPYQTELIRPTNSSEFKSSETGVLKANKQVRNSIEIKQINKNSSFIKSNQFYYEPIAQQIKQAVSYKKAQYEVKPTTFIMNQKLQKYIFIRCSKPFTQKENVQVFQVNKNLDEPVQFLLGGCHENAFEKNVFIKENIFGFNKQTYLIYGYPGLSKIIKFSHLVKKGVDQNKNKIDNKCKIKIQLNSDQNKLIFQLYNTSNQQQKCIQLEVSSRLIIYPLVGIKGKGSIQIL